MKFIRYLFTNVLVASFILGSHASAAKDVDIFDTTVSRMRSFKLFKDIVVDIEKISPSTAKDYKSFLITHDLFNQEIPHFTVTGREFVLSAEKNIKLSASETDELVLSWGSKKKVLKENMTFKDLVKEFAEFDKSNKYSFNFFIEDAHAEVIGSLIFAAAVGIGTYYILQKNRKRSAVAAQFKEACDNSDASTTIEDLVEAYNVVSEFRENSCRPEVNQDYCIDSKSALVCFRARIKQAKTSNDSDRSSVKEIHYKPASDEYIIRPKASKQ